MTLQDKIERIIALKLKSERIKAVYKELDELTLELLKTGRTHFSSSKYDLLIIDNFSDKNTGFKTTPFKRFEAIVLKKGT